MIAVKVLLHYHLALVEVTEEQSVNLRRLLHAAFLESVASAARKVAAEGEVAEDSAARVP